MLALAIFLIVFLSIGIVALALALCALCAGYYDEIYEEVICEQGD